MRIGIAIATVGRPALIHAVARHWLEQTRPADRIVIAPSGPADVGCMAGASPAMEIVFAPRGLPKQRNAALDRLAGDCDVVVFFDDDFVPSKHFLAQTEAILTAHPDIVVATGVLLDDGINKAGLSIEAAVAKVSAYDNAAAPPLKIVRTSHAYGCNMVLRVSAAPSLRFDERLPLYAWQEDRDISARMAPHGRVVRVNTLTGVHMGVKAGRQSGVRLGYSQIANPLYLVGKNVMTPAAALALAGKNVLANVFWSIAPEPWVDRAGRLRGNALALWDAARGKARPERILDL